MKDKYVYGRIAGQRESAGLDYARLTSRLISILYFHSELLSPTMYTTFKAFKAIII